MRILLSALLAASVLWPPAAAPTVLGTIAFDAPPYQVSTWRGEKARVREADRKGPKGKGMLWNWEAGPVTPADPAGFVRFHWWEYRAVNPFGPGSKWEDNAGFSFRGSAIEPDGGWQEDAEYFGRVRIRFQTPLRPDRAVTGATVNNKWFFTNTGRAPNRVMVHLNNTSGSEPCTVSSAKFPDDKFISIRIGKNIGDQCAGHALRIGQWENVQWSWRMGKAGRGQVRLWVNNDDEKRPTAERVVTEDWVMDPAGMNAEWHVGGYFSDELDADASWDIRTFEIGTAFDSGWASPQGRQHE